MSQPGDRSLRFAKNHSIGQLLSQQMFTMSPHCVRSGGSETCSCHYSQALIPAFPGESRRPLKRDYLGMGGSSSIIERNDRLR